MEVEVCRREVWRWRCVEGRYGGGGVRKGGPPHSCVSHLFLLVV